MKSLRLLSLFFLLAGLAKLSAQVVVTGYEQIGNLPANDDEYSAAVDMGFTINFGGTNYSQTYVHNNGFITFGSTTSELEYSPYNPAPIDANYVSSGEPGLPIIAVFFADVDTRFTQSGIVEWGNGTVDGHDAFVVKWPSVGEYASEVFEANSFSLVLVSRPDIGTGNFDVHFEYESILWDHSNAVAGFHNGSTENPLFYAVPGSGTEGAFLDGGTNALASSSNTGSAGALLLQARNGGFLEVAAIQAVPEPSTWALLGVGSAMLGLAWLRRRRTA